MIYKIVYLILVIFNILFIYLLEKKTLLIINNIYYLLIYYNLKNFKVILSTNIIYIKIAIKKYIL